MVLGGVLLGDICVRDFNNTLLICNSVLSKYSSAFSTSSSNWSSGVSSNISKFNASSVARLDVIFVCDNSNSSISTVLVIFRLAYKSGS